MPQKSISRNRGVVVRNRQVLRILQCLPQPCFIRKACQNPDESVQREYQFIVVWFAACSSIRAMESRWCQLNDPPFTRGKLVDSILNSPHPGKAMQTAEQIPDGLRPLRCRFAGLNLMKAVEQISTCCPESRQNQHSAQWRNDRFAPWQTRHRHQ